MRAHRLTLLLSCALLAACGGNKDGTNGAQGDDGLPKPAAPAGSVTGMPNPGVASTRPASTATPPADIAVADADAPTPMPDGETVAIDEGEDARLAVAVVRDYYAAINARDFATAHAQWGDGGRASGQSPQQFAAGFAGTEGVSVEIGAPGRIEGAAGSRYIDIPVTLEARQADGSLRRYAGRYALRRSMVDGATPEQQTWHIASAELREASP